MDINSAFPSNYVSAADLGGRDVTVTMSHVDMEDVGQPVERLPVLYFVGQTKGLVLNKTNASSIADMYGPETDNWRGQVVTLYEGRTDFGKRKNIACVRVRPGNGQHAMQPQPQPQPQFAQPQQFGNGGQAGYQQPAAQPAQGGPQGGPQPAGNQGAPGSYF